MKTPSCTDEELIYGCDNYCILGTSLYILNKSSLYCVIHFYDIKQIVEKIINNYYSNAVYVLELDENLTKIRNLDDYYFTEENLPLIAVIACDFNQKTCIQREAILNDYKFNYIYILNNEDKENTFMKISKSSCRSNIGKLITEMIMLKYVSLKK